MAKQRRQVTCSGLDGYIPLSDVEVQAYQMEVYFSATNINQANSISYEWYPSQTLYGRFNIARGKYTLKAHLVKYQNELIYTEIATLAQTLRRLQCVYRKLFDFDTAIFQNVVAIINGNQLPSPPLAVDLTPPQPFAVPGLQCDGIYYNMAPGCAGVLTIETWVDDDVCVDNDGNPLSPDGHGNPPDPASPGGPSVGDANSAPSPTYPSGGNPTAKPPSNYDPSALLPNPGAPQGESCTLYRVSYYPTIDGVVGDTQTLSLYGKIGQPGVQTAVGADGQPLPGQLSYYIPYGIGCAQPGKTEGRYGLVSAGSQTQVSITIVSVVPAI